MSNESGGKKPPLLSRVTQTPYSAMRYQIHSSGGKEGEGEKGEGWGRRVREWESLKEKIRLEY